MRQQFTLLFFSVCNKIFSLVKSFILGRYFGPGSLATLEITKQISNYNKYLDIGLLALIESDLKHLQKKFGDEEGKNVIYGTLKLDFCITLLSYGLGAVVLLNMMTDFSKILILFALSFSVVMRLTRYLALLFAMEGKFEAWAAANSLLNFSILIVPTVGSVFAGIEWLIILPPVIASPILVYLFSKVNVFRLLSTPVSFHVITNHKRRSALILLTSVSYGFFEVGTRWIVSKYLGVVALGFFGFSTMFVASFQQILNEIFKPYFFAFRSLLAEGDLAKIEKSVRMNTIIIYVFVSFLAVVITFLMPFLIQQAFPKYAPGIDFIIIFMLSGVYTLINSNLGAGLYAPGVNGEIKLISINLITTLIMIGAFGIHSADLNQFSLVTILALIIMARSFLVNIFAFRALVPETKLLPTITIVFTLMYSFLITRIGIF